MEKCRPTVVKLPCCRCCYYKQEKCRFGRQRWSAGCHSQLFLFTYFTFQSAEINNCACDLAREVANEGDALVAGGLSPLPGYEENKGHDYVKNEFRKQCKLYADKGVDFLLGEVSQRNIITTGFCDRPTVYLQY